jgi:hypothetical protein
VNVSLGGSTVTTGAESSGAETLGADTSGTAGLVEEEEAWIVVGGDVGEETIGAAPSPGLSTVAGIKSG